MEYTQSNKLNSIQKIKIINPSNTIFIAIWKEKILPKINSSCGDWLCEDLIRLNP